MCDPRKILLVNGSTYYGMSTADEYIRTCATRKEEKETIRTVYSRVVSDVDFSVSKYVFNRDPLHATISAILIITTHGTCGLRIPPQQQGTRFVGAAAGFIQPK